MKKGLKIESPSNKIVALFFLVVFTIFVFGWFFVIQLNLHNSVYKKDNATISKNYPGIFLAMPGKVSASLLLQTSMAKTYGARRTAHGIN